MVLEPGRAKVMTLCAPTSSNSRGSAHSAMRAQKFCAALGDRYPDACTRDRLARDVAAIDRVLPDRQPRARGAPGLDHLGIKPRLPRDPFDKIEHQRVCRVGHRAFSLCQKAKALLRTSSNQLP